MNPNHKPNVIILLTDDQGYGDLSCNGNPALRTPTLDRLHAESVRLTDFHVAPICTPTRSQLLTGLDALRTGAYSWAYGHECLFPEIPTMANLFHDNGYRTGHFGKWHLGDNYPYQPHHRGFEESIHHKGAAITQTPDYWNNDYFDDHYWHKDTIKQYKGYCTDVWFDQAMKFMAGCIEKSESFFVYLPTNCPHSPLYVPDHYRTPYRHLGHELASFFGMIANIDDNVNRLDTFLELNGIRDNTILIFMTDNGGTAGVEFYNAGMRGEKGSLYEGGHHVPCYIRWPEGALTNRDVDQPTQVQDILPTLARLCGLRLPQDHRTDGTDLSSFLQGQQVPALDRKLVVQFTRRPPTPRKWDATVIWNQWRLVAGNELYNIQDDPSQQKDMAAFHPDIVKQLRDHYEAWWESVEEPALRTQYFQVGGEHTQVVDLCLFDWDDYDGDGNCTLQPTIREGACIVGAWHIDVKNPGDYIVEMRRWPKVAETAIAKGVPEYQAEDDVFPAGTSLPIRTAELAINGQTWRVPVGEDDQFVEVKIPLQSGKADLKAVFLDEHEVVLCGVYYISIRSC